MFGEISPVLFVCKALQQTPHMDRLMNQNWLTDLSASQFSMECYLGAITTCRLLRP